MGRIAWTAIGVGALFATAGCQSPTCRLDADCAAGQVCAPDVSGQFSTCVDKALAGCRLDADCPAGETCDASSGKCAAPKCDKSCGDGFSCVLTPAGPTCVQSAGSAATASLTGAADGAFVGGDGLALGCDVSAPQVSKVELVAGADTVPMSASGSGFTATVDLAGGDVADGPLTLACRATFGPDGAESTVASAPVTVFVDRTKPTVTLDAPEGWQKASGTLVLRARVEDLGPAPSGVSADAADQAVTLAAGSYHLVGQSAGDGAFDFSLDLSRLVPDPAGEATVRVDATDRAGNAGEATATISLDDGGPKLGALTVPGGWHGLGLPVVVTAQVTTSRAPVAPGSVLLTAGDQTFPGNGEAGTFSFAIDPLRVAQAGDEKSVSFSIGAADEAGNEATPLTGSLALDGKAPTLVVATDTGVHGLAPVPISVQVTDQGSGVDPASVKVVAGGLEAACTGAQSPFSCPVPVAAATVSGAFGFQVVAADRVGNAASATGSVNVDRTPPVVTVTADTAWHSGHETVPVQVQVADSGSGVDPASVQVTVGGTKTACTAAAGGFSCPVSTALPGGGSGGFMFVVSAADRAGNGAQASGTLSVDTEPPVLTVFPDTGWHARGQLVPVSVKVTDGESGVDAASVKVQVGASVQSCSPSASGYSCPVSTAGAPSGQTTSAYPFVVFAADLEGNGIQASGTVAVDAQGPTVQVASDASWHGVLAAFTVTATITDGGVGLVGTRPVLQVTDPRARQIGIGGSFSGSTATFSVFPSAFLGSGVLCQSCAMQVVVQDALGNATTVGLVRNLDGQPPTVTPVADGSWHQLGRPASLVVQVADAGAGLADPPQLQTTGASGQTVTWPSSPLSGGRYSFAVELVHDAGFAPTLTLPAVPFTIVAHDAVGNAASATTQLAFDGTPPTLTDIDAQATLTGGRLALSTVAKILVATSDSGPDATGHVGPGAGVAAVFMTYPAADGSTAKVDGAGDSAGTYTFVFDPSTVAPPKDTDETVPLTFVAEDAAGNSTGPVVKPVVVSREAWTFDGGSSAISPVALSNGVVYFSAPPYVFAVDAKSGQQLWREYFAGLSGGAPTSPVAVGLKEVYVAGTICNSFNGCVSSIRAYNRTTGGIDFDVPVPTAPQYLAVGPGDWGGSAPQETVYAASGGSLYAAYGTGGSGYVYRYTGTGYNASPIGTLAVAGPYVWFGTTNGQVEVTQFRSGFFGSPTIPPAAFGPTLGVSLLAPNEAFAVQSNQLFSWSGTAYRTVDARLPSSQVLPPTFVTANRLYLTSPTSTGTELDRFPFDTTTDFSVRRELPGYSDEPPTVDADKNVTLAMNGFQGSTPMLLALDPDGNERWRFRLGDAGQNLAVSTPALGCDGTYYVGTSDGRLVAVTGDGVGLLASPWPRLLHDDRNTASFDTPLTDSSGACEDP